MSNTRRILGIDPGSIKTGVGIIQIQVGSKNPTCIWHKTLRLPPGEMALRLGFLSLEIIDLIKTFEPTELAIEQIFMHKNAQSALKLGQARGVAIAACVTQELKVFEYAPRQIKQATTGMGNANKMQVQQMIKILLNLETLPEPDAADALAVAMCHFHTQSLGNLLVKSLPKRRRSQRAQWENYDRSSSR